MNGELKKHLTKLMLESKMSWVKCLPLALLNIRTQPRTDVGISSFEMLYGVPYDVEIPGDHPMLENDQIKGCIIQLMNWKRELHKKGLIVQRPPLNMAIHHLKPGDKVLIKSWKETSLTPRWEGPYVVLLTTETTIRTAEKGWTHASRVKGPVEADNLWRGRPRKSETQNHSNLIDSLTRYWLFK